MAAHLPSSRAQSNIQMGSFLEGEEGKGFQMVLGRNWVWRGVKDKGEKSRGSQTEPVSPFPDVTSS